MVLPLNSGPVNFRDVIFTRADMKLLPKTSINVLRYDQKVLNPSKKEKRLNDFYGQKKFMQQIFSFFV